MTRETGTVRVTRLMRYRDQNGQDWADIVDFLSMYPDARRQVVRLLGELDVRWTSLIPRSGLPDVFDLISSLQSMFRACPITTSA